MISLADIAWDLASPQTSFGVLWGSFVTHSFFPQTNRQRMSAGRLGTRLSSRGKMKKKKNGVKQQKIAVSEASQAVDWEGGKGSRAWRRLLLMSHC